MSVPIYYMHLIALGFRSDKSKANLLFKTFNSIQKGRKSKTLIYKVTFLFIELNNQTQEFR